MRIVCWQTILRKYHALFVTFEKEAKVEVVVSCKLWVAPYGLSINWYTYYLRCDCFHICQHCETMRFGPVKNKIKFVSSLHTW